MSDRRRNKEIETRIGKANAALRESHRSVITKESFETPHTVSL